jgi:hypothetical protein
MESLGGGLAKEGCPPLIGSNHLSGTDDNMGAFRDLLKKAQGVLNFSNLCNGSGGYWF